MGDEKEVEIIENKEEIDNIINSKIKNKKIIFTEWYKIGIMRKGISEEKFDEVFSQFEKIDKIERERLKIGDIEYLLFYWCDSKRKSFDYYSFNRVQKKS